MTGLINAARQKMWEIVNECAAARPTPVLRVALLTYGGAGTEDDGYVIRQTPFTTDLDLVSEKLFALGTNGGTEYVGRVDPDLDRQTPVGRGRRRRRSSSSRATRAPTRTGARTFRDVVTPRGGARRPRQRDLLRRRRRPATPPAGARSRQLGGGRYATIDMNHGTVAVVSPYDKDLEELSRKINTTYLAYGARAEEAKDRQSRQDGNAAVGARPPAPRAPRRRRRASTTTAAGTSSTRAARRASTSRRSPPTTCPPRCAR